MFPYKALTAMVCITALLAFAMYLGRDGLLLAGGCSIIAGLGGLATGLKVKK